MGLEESTKKLDKYYSRLDKGKAQKIKPSHVERVIGKLKAKELSLREELAETTKPSKIDRLNRKIAGVCEQQERAKWLLDKISEP